ncbi:CGNR zinc finger domain-containing protein [Pseudomonas matsuisoli]|uniref:Zinc finger CGNR domain-containing protein n=1 Tax=Pseudomonas matsuisoli TaxID=1515666 RepID=A0A917V1F5_9PSED|nr:ABATE domain-containing protein [Pseudomonas matsuisoli]GGK08646.1 hypothetical protein GCM10009304_38410 [Pseudomonas matsuisoli]
MNITRVTPPGAVFLADNLALDFINSEYGMGEQHHDCFSDNESVMNWLKAATVLPDDYAAPAPAGLLDLAHEFRECARNLVNAAMIGTPADFTVINTALDAGQPVTALGWSDEEQAFQAVTQRRDDSPPSLLWPVAQSLVNLLTNEKFEFVRQCEAHDCVLLFHDLTKSHRRRWCSMATCGNRMKVAAFRSRNKR